MQDLILVRTSRIFFWLKDSSTWRASDPRSLASSLMKAPNCIRGYGRWTVRVSGVCMCVRV